MNDLAKLLMRISIGGFMLLHGIAKLRHGIAKIVTNVESHGLPSFVAYGVFVGEVVAPLLILAGFYTRPAGLLLAFNMVVAIWLSHSADIWKLAGHGGWKIELAMLYLIGGVVIYLVGAGRYSVRRGQHRWD